MVPLVVNRSGIKGTKGETDRVNYLRARGWHYATRIPKKGARDEGDIILDQAVPVMVESKETKSFTPSTFVAEMEAQITNAKAEFGFVIWKKRGTTDVGKYYALTTVEQIMGLVERVYSPSPPQARPDRVATIKALVDPKPKTWRRSPVA